MAGRLGIQAYNGVIMACQFGHTCGDNLMKIVAKRMQKVVGKKGIITRIGEMSLLF